MDHFEGIIKTLLEAEGYWVRQSFKVNLTKDEKVRIGKPSLPRPEIDLLAFKPEEMQIHVLEVKSYLDSQGVKLEDLKEQHEIPTGRYKLFTSSNYSRIVMSRLKRDLIAAGMATKDYRLQLGLVAGNVYRNESREMRVFMRSRHWFSGRLRTFAKKCCNWPTWGTRMKLP